MDSLNHLTTDLLYLLFVIEYVCSFLWILRPTKKHKIFQQKKKKLIFRCIQYSKIWLWCYCSPINLYDLPYISYIYRTYYHLINNNFYFRVLYGNNISDLPSEAFHGLSNLQLLLLNANKLQCLRKNTFSGLRRLNLLSLYDNQIKSIANGTFDGLTSLTTIHLARNPIICDCNLVSL